MIKAETGTSVVSQDERLLRDDELEAVSGGIRDEENRFIQDEENKFIGLISPIARFT